MHSTSFSSRKSHRPSGDVSPLHPFGFVRRFAAIAAIVLTLGGNQRADACGDYGSRIDFGPLIQLAVSEDTNKAGRAILELREGGPAALRAMIDANATLINQWRSGKRMPSPEWTRLRHALDSVARQKDAHASGLYWYTDFEKAKAAAAATQKPILSLRLLGRLDEELSCANSRFFRTTLYANREVANLLSYSFVLHWESVREVPKVTIDFGDGRILQQTITGNSIHYVLATDGTPIDALPGLYGARDFKCGLTVAADAARQYMQKPGADRQTFLREFHQGQLALLSKRWEEDLKWAGLTNNPAISNGQRIQNPMPTAIMACSLTLTKAGTERPFLQQTTIDSYISPVQLESTMNDETWRKLAAFRSSGERLNMQEMLLIQEKVPTAAAAGRLSVAKNAAQMPVLNALRPELQPLLTKLRENIAEDTVRNEYQIHRRIREWFIAGNYTADVAKLNRQVYAELFLTPETDPWLGLYAPDAFNAIENGGLVTSAKTGAARADQ